MIDVSDLRCEKGKSVLHHKWRLSEDGGRPASNYVGLVDYIDVEFRPSGYEVQFHEQNQTLKEPFYTN